ncbi:retrovirus-related pol polyprotein from transposon TNT 1-94 [Tanacetum coccineum]
MYVNKKLWLAYTSLMPPILLFLLSVACDDSDGCVTIAMAKGEIYVECDSVMVCELLLGLRPWHLKSDYWYTIICDCVGWCRCDEAGLNDKLNYEGNDEFIGREEQRQGDMHLGVMHESSSACNEALQKEKEHIEGFGAEVTRCSRLLEAMGVMNVTSLIHKSRRWRFKNATSHFFVHCGSTEGEGAYKGFWSKGDYKDHVVMAHADTPDDVLTAKNNGAQGIGLCRTEHRFFSSDERVKAVRKMIMVVTIEQRKAHTGSTKMDLMENVHAIKGRGESSDEIYYLPSEEGLEENVSRLAQAVRTHRNLNRDKTLDIKSSIIISPLSVNSNLPHGKKSTGQEFVKKIGEENGSPIEAPSKELGTFAEKVKRRIKEEQEKGERLLEMSEKIKIKEVSMVKLNARCLAVLQNKLPPKEKDPGSFILPCIIGNTTVSNALADLGASISVMPFLMFKRLGLGTPKPISMKIEMAGISMQSPKGIMETFLVIIDKFIFSMDFVILDIVEDNKVPITLGRPMLATAHARIDVFGWKISMEVGKENVIFNANEGRTSLSVCAINDF